MGTNRAHQDTSEDIIRSVIYGSPIRTLDLLILSINKYLNNEIRETIKSDPPQTSLLLIRLNTTAQTEKET